MPTDFLATDQHRLALINFLEQILDVFHGLVENKKVILNRETCLALTMRIFIFLKECI